VSNASSRTTPAGTPLGDDFHVYDTTLRDGAQREGISYSVADKLAVARLLDELGVGFIEGGWPGALPKDTEFFARAAAGELNLRHAAMVAFGSTRRPNTTAAADPQVRALLESQAPVVTLVAKSDRRHIELAEIDGRFISPRSLIWTEKYLHSRSDRRIEQCVDSGIARFLHQSSSAVRPRLKPRAGDGIATDPRETCRLRQFSRRNVRLRLKQMFEVGITRREPGCSFRRRENKTLRIIERIS